MRDPVDNIINKSVLLSLIHISEPTRRYAISYAVFCLKKNGRIEFEGGWFSAEMIRQIKAINLIEQPASFTGLVGVCESPGQPVDSVINWYKTAGCRTYIGDPIDVPFWNARTLYNHVEQHGLVNNIVDWVSHINKGRLEC